MSWLKGEYDEGRGGVRVLKIEGDMRGEDAEDADDAVNLLKEHLQATNELDLPDDNLEANFMLRIAFLERAFRDARNAGDFSTQAED